MSLTISQITAVAYPKVLAEKRRPANQWAESAFMRHMEKLGFIKHENIGATIEAPLDYQRNPGTVIQTTDLQQLSLTKTEVITSASYSPAQVTAPIVWTKLDEVQTSDETAKIAFSASLLENGIESHDDILEQQVFYQSTNGFLGLGTHVPTSGQGSDGGISAVTYTFWRNQASIYTDDTDIEAGFTTVWNNCAKGSGSKMLPTLMVSDGPTQALFESAQQSQQRWAAGDELNAGFKVLEVQELGLHLLASAGSNYSVGSV